MEPEFATAPQEIPLLISKPNWKWTVYLKDNSCESGGAMIAEKVSADAARIFAIKTYNAILGAKLEVLKEHLPKNFSIDKLLSNFSTLYFRIYSPENKLYEYSDAFGSSKKLRWRRNKTKA